MCRIAPPMDPRLHRAEGPELQPKAVAEAEPSKAGEVPSAPSALETAPTDTGEAAAAADAAADAAAADAAAVRIQAGLKGAHVRRELARGNCEKYADADRAEKLERRRERADVAAAQAASPSDRLQVGSWRYS